MKPNKKLNEHFPSKEYGKHLANGQNLNLTDQKKKKEITGGTKFGDSLQG